MQVINVHSAITNTQTLGNHEFSFPPADLAAYITKLKTPMLGGW